MTGELLRLSETPLHERRAWESGGITVLTAEVTLPRCGGGGRRARRFDRYYRQYARAYLKYCETELLPRAAETMRAAVERSAPWKSAHAALSYTVTLARGKILSVCTRSAEEELVPRLIQCRAEVWDMEKALPLALADFFPARTTVKKRLIRCARSMAAEQIDVGTAVYYPNYRGMLRRAFSSRNFYLAPDGLHWFYPMYTAAPAAEGIPDFVLSYREEEGPFEPREA